MRAIYLLLLVIFSGYLHAETDTTPQGDVDIRKYAGRWYEQARYENWFEKDMDNVYADYALLKDGDIMVYNTGTNKRGRSKRSKGKATTVNPGELSVSFVWPYWWFRTPYRILYVDKEYNTALVSGAGNKYLWLLTREIFPGEHSMNRLRSEAQKRGFDISRLRYTQHQKRKSTAPDTKKPG